MPCRGLGCSAPATLPLRIRRRNGGETSEAAMTQIHGLMSIFAADDFHVSTKICLTCSTDRDILETFLAEAVYAERSDMWLVRICDNA